jgi:hypothetical protein
MLNLLTESDVVRIGLALSLAEYLPQDLIVVKSKTFVPSWPPMLQLSQTLASLA